MGGFLFVQPGSMLIELILLCRRSDFDKDLEILLLRRQLAIAERRLSRAEQLSLPLPGAKPKDPTGQTAQQLRSVIRLFQPEPVLRWHREAIRRK